MLFLKKQYFIALIVFVLVLNACASANKSTSWAPSSKDKPDLKIESLGEESDQSQQKASSEDDDDWCAPSFTT